MKYPHLDLSAPSIFGYGVVAKGALAYLKDAQIYDDLGPYIKDNQKILASSEFKPERSSLELISPAIAPHHPLARAAKHLISELDFFAPALGRSIWVSGTNGKSSTTKMISLALNIPAAGNIGRSLAEVINTPLCVLEQSSFSLHYTKFAAPEIYVLQDIAPDHLSWHGDFRSYVAAKLSPLERMSAGAWALVPAWLSGHFKSAANVIYYSDPSDLARFFGFDLAQIRAKFSGFDVLNASLAAACACIVNGRFEISNLDEFHPAKHRCEIFQVGDVIFCDDSKATNAHAALAGLKTLRDLGFKRIHLLVGGDAKGQDLGEFLSCIKDDVKLYGIGAKDNSALLRRFDNNAKHSSMNQAIKNALDAYEKGDIIALMPACASLDQYTSYAARGEEFMRLAKELADA